MGETETPHFYDIGIFGGVPEPQKQLSLSLETPGYLDNIKKIPWNMFEHIVLINLKISEIQNCTNFRTKRAPTNDEDPSNKFLKILDMGSISIKNMKWEFGNMDKNNSKELKDFRIFETKKARDSETKKPRSLETKKPRNQGTKKPGNQKPRNLFYFQVRESPAPLNIPAPNFSKV